MIEYEYILKRDEQDELKTYKPNEIPTKLPNLVYIEGPNGSGKSTLLHLLALSFHGTRNRKIKKALQEKMENLVNSDHNHTTFKVSIGDRNNKTELSSEKKDFTKNEIILRDSSGKIVSHENFSKNYHLIYDIPENPTKRIGELTAEITDIQQRIERKVRFLREHLVNIITDIREAKDPNKIETVKGEITDWKEKMDRAEIKSAGLAEELQSVRLNYLM